MEQVAQAFVCLGAAAVPGCPTASDLQRAAARAVDAPPGELGSSVCEQLLRKRAGDLGLALSEPLGDGELGVPDPGCRALGASKRICLAAATVPLAQWFGTEQI